MLVLLADAEANAALRKGLVDGGMRLKHLMSKYFKRNIRERARLTDSARLLVGTSAGWSNWRMYLLGTMSASGFPEVGTWSSVCFPRAAVTSSPSAVATFMADRRRRSGSQTKAGNPWARRVAHYKPLVVSSDAGSTRHTSRTQQEREIARRISLAADTQPAAITFDAKKYLSNLHFVV